MEERSGGQSPHATVACPLPACQRLGRTQVTMPTHKAMAGRGYNAHTRQWRAGVGHKLLLTFCYMRKTRDL